jgi:hypothetical protein
MGCWTGFAGPARCSASHRSLPSQDLSRGQFGAGAGEEAARLVEVSSVPVLDTRPPDWLLVRQLTATIVEPLGR